MGYQGRPAFQACLGAVDARTDLLVRPAELAVGPDGRARPDRAHKKLRREHPSERGVRLTTGAGDPATDDRGRQNAGQSNPWGGVAPASPTYPITDDLAGQVL